MGWLDGAAYNVANFLNGGQTANNQTTINNNQKLIDSQKAKAVRTNQIFTGGGSATPNTSTWSGNPGGLVQGATDGSTGGASVNNDGDASATAEAARVARDNAERVKLRGGTREQIAAAQALYDQVFGDIDNLGRERIGSLEKDYMGKNERLTGDYLESLPTIENNYAAIGNDSSTYKGRALGKAEAGYKQGQEELGKAKGEDVAKVGSFVATNKAKYQADRDSMNRMGSRLDEVEDLGALREGRNSVEAKRGALQADRAGFMTDAGLQGELKGLTNASARFGGIAEAAKNIYGSAATVSMKNAALNSLIANSGLSPEEQQQILSTYSSQAEEEDNRQVA